MKYQAPLNGVDENSSYINAVVQSGVEGSMPPAQAFEQPQREILAVIAAAEIEPDEADLSQLLQAIQILNAAGSTKVTNVSTTNLNVLIATGTYCGSSLANAPSAIGTSWAYIEVMQDVISSSHVTQRLTTMKTNPVAIFVRQKINGGWGSWVQAAKLKSPAFTGSPTAPTQSEGDDSTKLSTTAYVQRAVAAGLPIGTDSGGFSVTRIPVTMDGVLVDLIIQTGSYSGANGSTVFPITFPNKVLICTPQPIHNAAIANGGAAVTNLRVLSTSGFDHSSGVESGVPDTFSSTDLTGTFYALGF